MEEELFAQQVRKLQSSLLELTQLWTVLKTDTRTDSLSVLSSTHTFALVATNNLLIYVLLYKCSSSFDWPALL